MIVIKGIALDEIDELDYNLDKIRKALEEKTSFWFFYDAAIASFEKERRIKKAGLVYRIALFITLIPKLLNIQFSAGERHKMIIEAERELIDYYQQPLSKVKRFRLKCQFEKNIYEGEIRLISEELEEHYKNLELTSLGEQTRSEIKDLIAAFEDKKSKKLSKYSFYEECEKRLIDIEEQIKVRQAIEKSRLKLEKMQEQRGEHSKKNEIEKEFELFQYYGSLLDSISSNLKRLELDKAGKIEEIELREMIKQMDIKN